MGNAEKAHERQSRIAFRLAPVLGICLLLMSAPVSAHAKARAKPQLALTLATSSITAHTPAVAHVTATYVPRGDRLYVQRQEGSRRVWRNVATLGNANATVSIPNIPMGRWGLRVAAIGSGKQAATYYSPVKFVYSYQTFTWNPIDNTSGTVSVGGRLFAFTGSVCMYYCDGSVDQFPSYADNKIFPSGTSCRSITVTFVQDDYDSFNDVDNPDAPADLEFVQTTVDPVDAETPADVVGQVTVSLDGGPLDIRAAVDSTSTLASTFRIDFSTAESCYTANGEK